MTFSSVLFLIIWGIWFSLFEANRNELLHDDFGPGEDTISKSWTEFSKGCRTGGFKSLDAFISNLQKFKEDIGLTYQDLLLLYNEPSKIFSKVPVFVFVENLTADPAADDKFEQNNSNDSSST